MKKHNEAYDENLTLTYEGGCPARFCKPEGYDNGQGKTYPEIDPLEDKRPINISDNVKRLIYDIESRETYG